MSFPPPGAGAPGSGFIYTSASGYSSPSDLDSSASHNIYSDTEAGYSSAASASFDSSFNVPGFVPSYASQRYPPGSSQSPPAQGAGGNNMGGSNGGSQQYQRIARFVGPPPVALACTECRSRHLKCDAGTPTCSRCAADKRECSYVKSRRGWKGTRRKKVAAAGKGGTTDTETASKSAAVSATEVEGNTGTQAAAPPLPPATTSGTLPPNITQQKLASPPPVPTANFSPPPAGPHTNPLSTLRAHQKNSTTFPTQQDPIQTPAATANLMQLYYAYFHASHPFCLPPAYLIKTNAVQLTVLLPVMRYIASVFSRTAPTDSFRLEAESALFGVAHPPPRNAFTVQALLLFAIGLHSENESDRASQVKDIAADLALELGMNQAEFSAGGGGDGPAGEMARVLNESWRRTWWELYFIDGLIAGIHQRGAFKLWSVECTVPLPCEEADYAAGRIPEPHSLQEFDDRYFATDNTVFSSFSYRVEAVRILGQVLAVGTGGVSDDTRADAADAGLANWGLHLPRVKKELVGGDRRVDEMLFQAHMVINAAIIYLNRPKSHLAISLIPDSTTVTPPTTWSPPTKPIALHTARTLLAANAISKLLTLPTPLVKHTPFFTCIITLACIVHLSACSWLLSGDEAFLAKERIRLGVGALKGLDGTWGVAAEVLGQVKWVARECFALEEGEGGGVVGGVGGGAAEAEEVLRYLEEERAMGEEAWGADAGGVVGALALPVGGVEWDGT